MNIDLIGIIFLFVLSVLMVSSWVSMMKRAEREGKNPILRKRLVKAALIGIPVIIILTILAILLVT